MPPDPLEPGTKGFSFNPWPTIQANTIVHGVTLDFKDVEEIKVSKTYPYLSLRSRASACARVMKRARLSSCFVSTDDDVPCRM